MWLGIDVGKDSLVVALQKADSPPQTQTFENTARGLKDLGKWLKAHHAKAVTVCLEATGLYGLEAATALHQAGHRAACGETKPTCWMRCCWWTFAAAVRMSRNWCT